MWCCTRRSCFLLIAVVLALAHRPACRVTASDPDVTSVTEKHEWQRAWSHQAMEPLYNSSLYPDIAIFRDRIRLLSALGIANQIKRYHMNNTRIKKATAVVVVRGGKVSGVTFDDFNPAFRIRLDSVVTELQLHQDAGHVALQDTVFILNTRDVPVCSLGFCLVPMFSPIKEVRAGAKSYNEDLLVPLMAYPHEHLVYYPPEKKIERGVMAVHKDEPAGSEASCRWFVNKFAKAGGPGSNVLTVLDSKDLMRSASPQTTEAAAGAAGAAGPDVPVSGMSSFPPPPEPLSKYKVAISCDRQAANPGLAGLLHTNSLVVKGRSNWAEFYYRSLQEGVHFVEFDGGFTTEVVKEALLVSSRKRNEVIIEAAQRFAYTYLSQRSRALFYEKAISEYNKLFGEGYMQATVADLPASRPLAMEDILAMRMYPSTWRQGLA